MRALRVLGLVLVVAFVGLLSGGAAGAASTATAVAGVAAGALPESLRPVPAAAPAVAAAPAAAAPAAAAAASAAAAAAPAAAPPAPRAVAGTPCSSNARACLKLSTNQSWLIRDGVVEYGPVPITHGRPGWRTPPGTFHVTFKNKNHRSSIFDNAPMPYSVFFNGGIAFHQGSLRVQSHGCIHLSTAAAKMYFASLNRGDVVQVVR